MAGHVRFGARTGGRWSSWPDGVGPRAPLQRFRGHSLQNLPSAILGVILFFTGLELASITKTLAIIGRCLYHARDSWAAMWNMGVAYLAGLVLYYGVKKGF